VNKFNFSRGDRFLKKEWWDIKAPGMFPNRKFTKSPVNQTVGKKLSSDALKGRVFEANVADLHPGMVATKKIKLIVDDTTESKTRLALTNFYGMDTTRDHLNSLIKKWHTLIESFVDVKTQDGFLLRFSTIAFTARGKYQYKATTYAMRSQVKQIRKIMGDVITREVARTSLKDLVVKLMNDKIPMEITQKAKKIFPIENCIVKKVKTVKRPRFDISQLLSIQSDIVGLTTATDKATEETKKEETENLVR
jgi:small subunit ribosomal protein S3Ae